MTSSDDDHGLQRQVQDRHSEELHAWSLQMIMWWTCEDSSREEAYHGVWVSYLKSSPSDVIMIAFPTWAKHKRQTSRLSEMPLPKVLVPLVLDVWINNRRKRYMLKDGFPFAI